MTPLLGGDTCYGRGTLVPHVGTSGGTPRGGSGGRGSTALVRAATGALPLVGRPVPRVGRPGPPATGELERLWVRAGVAPADGAAA